jgi:hypothetical protein
LTVFQLALLLSVLVQSPAIQIDPFGQLLTYGTAFAATAVLGFTKKQTTFFDTAIGKAIKPIQPWLVLGLTALLPQIIHGTPNTPDAGQLVAAPTATLLAVGAAEIIRRFFPNPPNISAARSR